MTTDYSVSFLPIDDVQPSPENNDIYGEVAHDEQMDSLIHSIESRGLEEPIIITDDRFILSGHRRFYACHHLGWNEVPVRIKHNVTRNNNSEYHRMLTEYNPQRIKTAGALLKEALLRFKDDDPGVLIREHNESSIKVDADFLDVAGVKWVRGISEKKQGFLEATIDAIDRLNDYWPLSVRHVHYRLLNDPPLKSEPKRSKFPLEHYRYKNDLASYNALIDLLTSARYHGHISMGCIDDATRPRWTHDGFTCVSEFVQSEVEGFLTGYHRDRQINQPRHIEVLGEKNTLTQILKPVCEEYYVPLTLGRGYASVPVFRDMADRFQRAGKEAMTLIVASDYDPEGFDLADDAIRSLRGLWKIPVDYHRIAVCEEQIEELDLQTDFNPAKETSSRLESFVARTGGDETWELESLPPEYLADQVRCAIEANMDMEVYRQTIEQQREDAKQLAELRSQIASDFNL